MSQPNEFEPETPEVDTEDGETAREPRKSGKAKGFAGKAARAAEHFSERLGEDVRGQAERFGRDQQDRIESYINAVRVGIEAGSQALEEDGYSTSARFARMAADQIDNLGDKLADSDLGHYVRALEDTVRSRPVIALGAAALLGFAAIQIFRSDEPRRRRSTRH